MRTPLECAFFVFFHVFLWYTLNAVINSAAHFGGIMKRIAVSFIMIISAISLFGCGVDTDSVEEIPENKEQVVVDTISDYTTLSRSELEVLAYDDDPEAQYQLGVLFEYGSDEVSQDYKAAIDWYTKSALHDNANAYEALGYIYLNGCGTDIDLEIATENFNQAVELGNIGAKVGIGRTMLAELSDEELDSIIGLHNESSEDEQEDEDSDKQEDVEQDAESTETDEETLALEEKATNIYTCFRDAEAIDDLDGIYYFGYLYEKGISVKRDEVKAKKYYEAAASSESTDITDQYAINMARTSLGLLYMNGLGVIADQEKALEYFTSASDNGFAKAQFYIGQIYENGLGVEKDYEKAMEYYKLASEQDFAPAHNQIGYLYYNGLGVDVDFASAVYYQKLAALQGYAPAQINLGFLYENGYGVDRNLETALSYYELAESAGYEGATEAIVRVRAQMNEEV